MYYSMFFRTSCNLLGSCHFSSADIASFLYGWVFAWRRPYRLKRCIITFYFFGGASFWRIFWTKILAYGKHLRWLTSHTQSCVFFSSHSVHSMSAASTRVTEGDQVKLDEKEKVMDGERGDKVRVRDRERMGERAKHPLMLVGWSGLLFRTQAGMVNIGGFSNQRLWSQPCWEMMLMTQWCQNNKECPLHSDTHLLLYVEILASTSAVCFHSSPFSPNLSFPLSNSSISIFFSSWRAHTIP